MTDQIPTNGWDALVALGLLVFGAFALWLMARL